jgi:hypothetical protein
MTYRTLRTWARRDRHLTYKSAIHDQQLSPPSATTRISPSGGQQRLRSHQDGPHRGQEGVAHIAGTAGTPPAEL